MQFTTVATMLSPYIITSLPSDSTFKHYVHLNVLGGTIIAALGNNV